MGSCRIVNPGILTTVQDLGRPGHNFYAIPGSGAMDRQAHHQANLMVGNDISFPTIECALRGPEIEFLDEATIALTGAGFNWKLNNSTVPRYKTLNVSKGDILKGGFAKDGLRAYLAISGKIITPVAHGSASSYAPLSFGLNEGKGLAKGSLIEWQHENKSVPEVTLLAPPTPTTISVNRGPEYVYLNKKIVNLWMGSEFSISSESNRMGARLNGPALSCDHRLGSSVPVLPGFIQLTPAGQMIVVLYDGQTTGGYPRIGYLNSVNLNKLNQLGFNQSFTFDFS